MSGGYPPSIEVERPESGLDVEEAKRKAHEEGVNTFKPFETEEEYEGGNVRALFIGVNYIGSAAELSGCVNDVAQTIATMDQIDFPIQEAAILVDDPEFPNVSDPPTNANIKKYLGWLIDDAKAGDVLYFHYSGHGGRLPSRNDKYEDYDSAILPNDYETKGAILDDDLFKILAEPLPVGVRMTVCFDCCHSASMLDLPYGFAATADIPDEHGDTHFTMKQLRDGNFCNADILMIAGCADDDTSADVSNTASFDSSDIEGAGGAATQAWTYMLENQHGSKYIDAIIGCRKTLSEKGFTQVPQLSSSKPLDLDNAFSLFGLLSIDEQMQDTLPEAFQKPPPEIKGIPKRFRHQFMSDFDPSALQYGFIPPHLQEKKQKHSEWFNNDWLATHPDKRVFHRLGVRPIPKHNCRDIRKKKFRVSPEMNVEAFLQSIDSIVQPQVGRPVVYYVEGQILEDFQGMSMSNIYDFHKDEDHFLYVTYAPEGIDMDGNEDHIGMYKRTHTAPRRVLAAEEALHMNAIPVIIERMDRPMPRFDPLKGASSCRPGQLPFGYHLYQQRMANDHPSPHKEGKAGRPPPLGQEGWGAGLPPFQGGSPSPLQNGGAMGSPFRRVSGPGMGYPLTPLGGGGPGVMMTPQQQQQQAMMMQQQQMAMMQGGMMNPQQQAMMMMQHQAMLANQQAMMQQQQRRMS